MTTQKSVTPIVVEDLTLKDVADSVIIEQDKTEKNIVSPENAYQYILKLNPFIKKILEISKNQVLNNQMHQIQRKVSTPFDQLDPNTKLSLVDDFLFIYGYYKRSQTPVQPNKNQNSIISISNLVLPTSPIQNESTVNTENSIPSIPSQPPQQQQGMKKPLVQQQTIPPQQQQGIKRPLVQQQPLIQQQTHQIQNAKRQFTNKCRHCSHDNNYLLTERNLVNTTANTRIMNFECPFLSCRTGLRVLLNKFNHEDKNSVKIFFSPHYCGAVNSNRKLTSVALKSSKNSGRIKFTLTDLMLQESTVILKKREENRNYDHDNLLAFKNAHDWDQLAK